MSKKNLHLLGSHIWDRIETLGTGLKGISEKSTIDYSTYLDFLAGNTELTNSQLSQVDHDMGWVSKSSYKLLHGLIDTPELIDPTDHDNIIGHTFTYRNQINVFYFEIPDVDINLTSEEKDLIISNMTQEFEDTLQEIKETRQVNARMNSLLSVFDNMYNSGFSEEEIFEAAEIWTPLELE